MLSGVDVCPLPASDCKPSTAEVVVESSLPELRHRPGRPPACLQMRGLIDGLTRFFTPSDRRGPRVCRELLTSDARRRYTRRPKTSSPAESSGDTVVTPSDLSPPEGSPGFDSERVAGRLETVAGFPQTAAHRAEDVSEPLENSSRLPLPSEGRPALLQSVTERLKPPSSTNQPVSKNCGTTTTTKRSREQLTDGLTHFFTAVGKRRRCSAPKHISSTGKTPTAKNSYLSDAAKVVLKSPVSCRFRTKFSPNKRIATVRLKRLPTKLTWELQRTDDDDSPADKKPEIYGKLFSDFCKILQSVDLYLCKLNSDHGRGCSKWKKLIKDVG